MKKVMSIVMVVMMAIGLMIPAFGTAESVKGHSEMYVYCANGKRLNLRDMPTLNSSVLLRLDNGTKVGIIADMGEGWARVSANGREGFVKTSFLTSKKPGTAAGSSMFKSFAAKVYSDNGKKVNMRVRADINADRIAQLENYTSIQVIGETGSWYKIKWANAVGYMMKQYVRA
ncbi:MAG: SH3 domain-containing protein [Clostridia bacterium]|nr:SH3 domain-containing protein [Clostridia bacterium]